MPIRIALSDNTEPRFDLIPGEETCNYEDGTFVPHLSGMKVGDLVRINSLLVVSKIVGEDERGHRVETAYRLPEPEWVD